MHLSDLWFIAIAVLRVGYVILEGFDFGVGILLPVLGRGPDETRRRIVINAIGPVWDGNEVWLITAGEIRGQANVTARRAGLLAVLAGGGFLAWTELGHRAAGHAAPPPAPQAPQAQRPEPANR